MRYEQIKAGVRSEVETTGADVDTLYLVWKAAHGDDPDGFLAHLHDQRLISDETFMSLHADDSLDLNSFATLASMMLQRTGEFGAGADPADEPQLVASFLPTIRESGNYTWLGKIGEGAMGEVHVAKDADLARKVAYKQMSEETAAHPAMAARFFNEAQITAQLDHPNIVPVYALETGPDGRLAYTMKLIRGHTLQQLVEQVQGLHDEGRPVHEDLQLNARLEHFLKVCDALHYAHSRGVVHRDLKPENIMVGPFREVYVMDWGIARRMDAGFEHVEEWVDLSDSTTGGLSKTRVGMVIGTPAFMSPEQAEGLNQELDGRSDQFSLGLILFELVALKPAVSGTTALNMLERIRVADLDPLVHYAGTHIPRELRAIIAKATQREPAARYPSVEDLADDLRRFLRGEEVLADPDRWMRRLGRWVNHHPLSTFGGAAAMVIAALLFAMVNLLWQQYRGAVAEVREARLGDILTAVARQGASIDADLLRYEGLLGTLAESAVETLSEKQPDARKLPWFLKEADFEAPDQVASARYNRLISLSWPVLRRPRDARVSERDLARLVPLRRQIRRVFLTSHSPEALGLPPAEQDDLLAQIGVPFASAYVALKDGVFIAYPGHGGFPPGYNPLRQPWYRLAQGTRQAQWGNPHLDPGGLGLMLPCSVSLFDDKDQFRGVAAVEVTFGYIIDQLLENVELAERSEAFLVDERGRMVVRSDRPRRVSRKGASERSLRLQAFPVPELAKAVEERSSGWFETDRPEGGRDVVLYYRMNSVGWYYVVRGDSNALLQ